MPLSSSITNSSVSRAGGGGGAGNTNSTGGGGGAGSGGNGIGGNATSNTGSGGGGALSGTGGTGGNGGSGIIILKIPDSISALFSAGVTQTSSTSGGFKIFSVTTAGTNDTVTFS